MGAAFGGFGRARSAGTEFLVNAFQAKVPITFSPLTHGHSPRSHVFGDGCVGLASTAGQPDVRALHDRVGQRAGVGDALQLLNFVLREDQRRHRTADSHGKTAPGVSAYSIQLFAGLNIRCPHEATSS